MIYRWCPLKWTNAEINVLSCNTAERGVSTKVDKLKERAQINIEASKGVSTKVDKYQNNGLSYNASERGGSTKVDRQ